MSMSNPLCLLLKSALLIGCLSGCSKEGVSIHGAWISETPPGAQVQAGYMTIANNTGAGTSLVGAASTQFEDIQIHRSQFENESGFVRMVHEEQVDIEPGGSIHFKPGGYHLMLMRPVRALKAGESVPLTLLFIDGQKLTVMFDVRRDGLKL